VRFRFDAPKHTFVRLEWPSWQNPSTGEERPVGAVSVDTLWDVNAGQSREFTLLLPPDVGEVWRLRCQVGVDTTGVRGVLTRVKLCWQKKSFTPLRWTVYRQVCVLESDFITNAVPADALRP